NPNQSLLKPLKNSAKNSNSALKDIEESEDNIKDICEEEVRLQENRSDQNYFKKQKNKKVLNNLERSFDPSTGNIFFNLKISVEEPVKVTFDLDIEINNEINELKYAIAQQLKERFPKLFKKLTVNSFVLMGGWSLIEDDSLLIDSGVRNGDI